MEEESLRDGAFTPEQLQRLRKIRLITTPLRVIVALSVFSLAAGGPKNFFIELPGQVFSIVFAVQVFLERFFQAPDFGGKSRDEGSVVLGWIAFGGAYALSIADWYLIRPHLEILAWSPAWLLAGALVVAAGQSLRVVAIRSLGRFFTTRVRLQEGQSLIREGLYRRLRHPAYTGLLLGTLGCITLFASVLGYAAFFFVALPAMLYRIRVEEAAMIERFGDEYLQYRRQTWRLIPFVY